MVWLQHCEAYETDVSLPPRACVCDSEVRASVAPGVGGEGGFTPFRLEISSQRARETECPENEWADPADCRER